MFCARAGAKRVYAVDASAIISKARANVARNGLSSTITCVHGKMEEVTLPGLEAAGGTVDVIVSEWMGYCLLFEAMLPSVLWARDRYLRRDGRGLMVPSHASLWAAPAADPRWAADHARPFWHDVYGFDMRSMAAGLEDEARVLVARLRGAQQQVARPGEHGRDDVLVHVRDVQVEREEEGAGE